MKQQTDSGKNFLQEILNLIKRNIILIIAITLTATAVGWIYSVYRKPKYVVEEQVIFSMGNGVNVQSDVNAMYAYKGTVMDFCDTGVVVDRANFYFQKYVSNGYRERGELQQFVSRVSRIEERISAFKEEISLLQQLKQKKEDLETIRKGGVTDSETALYNQTLIEEESLRQQIGITETIMSLQMQIDNASESEKIQLNEQLSKERSRLIEAKRGSNISDVVFSIDNVKLIGEMIEEINAKIELEKEDELYYVANNSQRNTDYINASAISVKDYATDSSTKSFSFGIKYTDNTKALAEEKVKMTILAFDVELSYFFEEMYPEIEDMGIKSWSTDMSQKKIVLLACLAGIVLSFAVVYCKKLLDKTVKDRETVEEIMGVRVLALIQEQEVKHNG